MNNGNEREILQCRRLVTPHAECKCEFSLPDYLGDVRKILLTDAHVRGAGRFADADGAEFPGIVVFDVVYLDADGEICSVSFNGDYDMRVKHTTENGAELFADPEIDSYSIRLPGPRKLSAKAMLTGRAYVSEPLCHASSGTAFECERAPQLRMEDVAFEGMRRSPTVEREYGELLTHLDGAIADEVRVMYPRAEVRLDTAVPTDEGALLKGEVRMSAIVKNGDEPAFCVTRSVPLEETVPFEITDGSELIGRAVVTSVSHSVNADDTGSEVVLSVIVELCADELYNEQTSVIADAYMTECVTENIYEDMDCTRFCGVHKERLSCQGELARTELDVLNLREVVCMCASARVDSCEPEDGQVKVDGSVQFSGICSTTLESGAISYVGVKIDAPFTQNVKIDCQNADKMIFEPCVSAHAASGTIDAEKVYASCDLTLEIRTAASSSLRVLSTCNARTDLPFAKDGATVTVYYPDRGETLYSIAKRFHTTVASIAEKNSLSEAVMAGDTDAPLADKLLIY